MTEMSLEEKVDLLLKYHRQARRWYWIKMALILAFFIVFVVLPLLWLRSFILDVMQSADFQSMQNTLDQLGEKKGALDAFFEQILPRESQ
jgi:predicted nucleic acid-binding Zn ribbon protein